MSRLRNFFVQNGPALITYLLLLCVAGFFILSYEKNAIHLYVNQYVGNRYVNALFFMATYLGDGLLAPLMVIAVSIVNVRAGMVTALSLIVATLIATLLKYQVFDDSHRPYFEFQYYDRHELNLVEGVHVNILRSFPSGHSTQAFSIMMTMLLIARRQAFKFLFLLFASLTAFSRVYLSQHWLVDIVAGSILGTACSLLFYFIYVYRDRARRLDRPLATFLSKRG